MEKSTEFIVNRVMKNNFSLAFESLLQPIFDTSSFKCVGTEMLIRGVHRRNLIAPNLFINRLEENGGIVSLGEHVIEMAFSYMAEVITPHNAAYPLHLNLSPVQLNDEGFAGRVCALAARLAVPVGRIVFEITDNDIALDDTGRENALRLREAGFLMAWDNIHGVNQLQDRLALLSVDFIKLDRSCFKASCTDETLNIVRCAQDHEVDVIAEGVETFSQMQMLFNNNVRMAQGFLFSRPLDRDSFRRKYLLMVEA
ncbi:MULTISPECIES: EAL domain-containing protein [Cedecea]|uniref:Cyclic diguanylate phosphodiesterase domain protein n=1 Tax=Cedecea davisae DSM 4568 TaxID=566551 RepID=S3JU83_9ENTR|nr:MULTISPECIES: EAL domain-containing protein [Cedecea]EPF16669.1 cyclic diguanylate phosphodiesterase domain protein [Cedecea davisae DSM 4568]QIX97640.1 EAL domain-containing protein [Cedecea sp. FDAARGOS_727]STA45333.1 biofilm formation regulator HmsP [Cedecea davisae]